MDEADLVEDQESPVKNLNVSEISNEDLLISGWGEEEEEEAVGEDKEGVISPIAESHNVEGTAEGKIDDWSGWE